jgi:hypothetical protein
MTSPTAPRVDLDDRSTLVRCRDPDAGVDSLNVPREAQAPPEFRTEDIVADT